MSYKKQVVTLVALLCASVCEANSSHPFYAGLTGGYGSTTWDGLVPTASNQNLALSMSTPIDAIEGGAVWGALIGYEFTPYFALEGNYTHYHSAEIFFDPTSLFSFENDNVISFRSDTESLSVLAKIMLLVPKTKLRVFSSAGFAEVHRVDRLMDDWHAGPSFGVGFNYHFSEQFMGELGFNYTAGFGESALSPTDTYIPFLYSGTLKLAYLF